MEKIKVFRGESIKYEIEGMTMSELVEFFEAARGKYPSDAYLDISTEDDYGSSTATVSIYWSELESDEEFETRKRRQESHLQYEREMYENLKKKFEGDK